LVRRAAALQHVAESPDSGVPNELRAGYDAIAARALNPALPDADRGAAENAVGRALIELAALPEQVLPEADAELHEAAARVLIARRFYNDAVRDTRSLRARRLPRLFRMAGRRPMPEFFDIDDTVPSPSVPVATRPAVEPQPEEDQK
jgi:hypothetical protein